VDEGELRHEILGISDPVPTDVGPTPVSMVGLPLSSSLPSSGATLTSRNPNVVQMPPSVGSSATTSAWST
jgi:hypothetical protein